MVDIPFTSNVTNAVAGIKQLQTQLQALGLTAQQVNNVIGRLSVNKVLFPPGSGGGGAGGAGGSQSTAQAVQNFKSIENSALRVVDRLARFLTAISGVKNALDLVSAGSALKFSDAFTAAGEGLRVFANLAQLAKTNVGLLRAGLAGAAFATLQFVTSFLEARIKVTNENIEASLKAEASINSLRDSLDDATKSANVFGDVFVDKRKLEITRAAFEATQKQIRELRLEADKLQARADSTSGEEHIGVVNLLGINAREIEALSKRLGDIARTAPILQVKAQVQELYEELGKLNHELFDLTEYKAPALQKIAEILQPGAAFGQNLIEEAGIKSTTERLRLETEKFEALLKTKTAIETLRGKSSLSEDDSKFLREHQFDDADLEKQRQRVLKAQKEQHEAEAPKEFTERFTKPFTEAIGNAVINGIIEGKKGMEILADISKNLLTAALNDVMKNFQQGMIDVFKSIAGAGGELLGSALITVVGVVAGILGKRASSTDSFSRIKNLVESTESVRGIVAGPQNVAIAAVGDNLKRALVGVESRLDVMIGQLSSINSRVAGVPFAGSVTA